MKEPMRANIKESNLFAQIKYSNKKKDFIKLEDLTQNY